MIHKPARHLKANGRMAVMTTGMHETRTFGCKAKPVGQMRLIVRLANEHAVHVCAESRRRPWPACIKHRHRARIALGLVQEGLRHAVLKSTDHAVLHELRIPSENLRLIDVGLPDRDWKAEIPEKTHDEVRRLEFRPALFRSLVQLAAVADHFLVILGFVFHDGLLKFSSRGLICNRQSTVLQSYGNQRADDGYDGGCDANDVRAAEVAACICPADQQGACQAAHGIAEHHQ